MTKSITDMIRGMDAVALEQAIKDMRTYKACHRVSRTRANDLYVHKTEWILRKKVEHFGPLGAQEPQFTKLYADVFGVTDRDIEFIQNDDLDGGVRMFYGDDMVELSLRDFERSLLSIS